MKLVLTLAGLLVVAVPHNDRPVAFGHLRGTRQGRRRARERRIARDSIKPHRVRQSP